MLFIGTGCCAFLFFYLFDLNKVKFLKQYLYIFFVAGIVLLAFATVEILLGNYQHFEVSMPLKLLFGSLSFASLLMLFYTLFVALPYGETYFKVSRQTTVDRGMYALCRHPGVVWFLLFYLFLWLASGKTMMMWAGTVWTAMDIIHVYVEDRWFFPKIHIGYDQYKIEVPFLIPNLSSIKKYIATSI